MSSLDVTVLDKLDDFLSMASVWNQLLSESRSGSFFLTWEWLFSWAECCLGENRCLFILAFYEKDLLIGIAPFYIEKIKLGLFSSREIHFLGTPEAGSDYLDVFTQKGKEKEVANALYDFLMNEGASGWDQIKLQEIPANSLFLLHYMNKINAKGKYFEITKSSCCPIANLKPTFNEYFDDLSPKRKQRFNQKTNILNRHGSVSHEVFNDLSDHVIDNFFELYEKNWSSRYVRSILLNLQKRQGSEKNIQVDMLSVDGQPVAGLFFVKYKNVISQYLMASDKTFLPKASVGNILIGLCIKNAISNGFETYDLLKGEADYKFHWATNSKVNMQLYFWQKRPIAVVTALARLTRYAGKLLLR